MTKPLKQCLSDSSRTIRDFLYELEDDATRQSQNRVYQDRHVPNVHLAYKVSHDCDIPFRSTDNSDRPLNLWGSV